MYKLWQLLTVGHVHKWVEVDKRKMKRLNPLRGRHTDFVRHTLRCEHCGKMKKWETI